MRSLSDLGSDSAETDDQGRLAAQFNGLIFRLTEVLSSPIPPFSW